MNVIKLSYLCRLACIPLQVFNRLRGFDEHLVWSFVQDQKKWSNAEMAEFRCLVNKKFAEIDVRKVLDPTHSLYPKDLLRLHNPPVHLQFEGDPQFLSEVNLSVVGSRNARIDFIQWMNDEYSLFLEKNHCVTVSGGAVGVDQLASQMALRNRQPTIIVLPCGLQRLYPKNLEAWRSHRHVLFISEYDQNEEMRTYHFVNRNRIIAALSKQLFVVHCSSKSGTMLTVKHALDVGTSVATIPDFPFSNESSGNLQILRDGGTFVVDHQDLELFVKSN